MFDGIVLRFSSAAELNHLTDILSRNPLQRPDDCPSFAVQLWVRTLTGSVGYRLAPSQKTFAKNRYRFLRMDDAILPTWVRSQGEPDWQQAAEIAVRMLHNREDLEILAAGIQDERRLQELKNMVKTAHKSFLEEWIAEERADAAQQAEAKAEREKAKAEREKAKAEREMVEILKRTALEKAEQQLQAARDKVHLLERLAETHSDILPMVEQAQKEVDIAEAQLAKLTHQP